MGLRVRLKSEATCIDEECGLGRCGWMELTKLCTKSSQSSTFCTQVFQIRFGLWKIGNRNSSCRKEAGANSRLRLMFRRKLARRFLLSNWVEFRKPGEAVESGRKPSVFLSFSTTDGQIVRILRDSLENQGIEVLSPEDLAIGDSWRSALTEGITRAQVVAFLVSGELRGFAEQELALAQQGAKSVVPILVGQASGLPQPFEQVQAMHMRSEKDVGPVADLLAARAKNLFYEDEKRSS